jgi:excisionase family DNA binding protein
MLKGKMLSISIFCLAISIIISCFILTKGIKDNGEYVGAGIGNIGSVLSNASNNLTVYYQDKAMSRDNYNLDDAAAYLGIARDKLVKIVDNKDYGIPYVKIESNYIFNKKALEKWLETARIEIHEE